MRCGERRETLTVRLQSRYALFLIWLKPCFGTGYSSLAYLKRLPIDEVKIDKALVFGLGADAADIAIVRAGVAMARPLGCEGVESVETWTFLRELGCGLAQGYYLSHPLPAAALEQWAQTSPWGVQEQSAVTVAYPLGARAGVNRRQGLRACFYRIMSLNLSDDCDMWLQNSLGSPSAAYSKRSSWGLPVGFLLGLQPISL